MSVRVWGGRLGRKGASGEGHSREGVKNDGDLEMKETEQAGDVGQIRQPDMVRVSSPHGPPGRWARGGSRLRQDFTSYPANGFPGEFPPGAGEGLGDELVAAKADERHGLNQVPDDIGVAADRRLGPYEGADGVSLRQGFLVPASDGVGRNEKSRAVSRLERISKSLMRRIR